MDVAARVARRLAARWSSDAWTGVCVRIVTATTREERGERVAVADHFLAAAWPPAGRGPSRWPEAVSIGSPESHHALFELFGKLPPHARLYLASPDEVDAALAAEVLLASDRNLERYQRDALQAFVAYERQRTRDAAAARYSDRDAGFERFRTRLGVPGAGEGDP
jgi:hypothetical protein